MSSFFCMPWSINLLLLGAYKYYISTAGIVVPPVETLSIQAFKQFLPNWNGKFNINFRHLQQGRSCLAFYKVSARGMNAGTLAVLIEACVLSSGIPLCIALAVPPAPERRFATQVASTAPVKSQSKPLPMSALCWEGPAPLHSPRAVQLDNPTDQPLGF